MSERAPLRPLHPRAVKPVLIRRLQQSPLHAAEPETLGRMREQVFGVDDPPLPAGALDLLKRPGPLPQLLDALLKLPPAELHKRS